MNLNHLPVARKLWALVLGLMISMLALLAGLLSYSMHIDDDAARVVHFNEERIGLALRWKSLSSLAVDRVVNALSSNDEELTERLVKQSKEGIQAIDAVQKQIEAALFSPADKEQFQRVLAARKQVLEHNAEAGKLRANLDHTGARAVLDGKMLPAVDRYVAEQDAFVHLQERQRDAAKQRAAELAADRESLVNQFRTLSTDALERQGKLADSTAEQRLQATHGNVELTESYLRNLLRSEPDNAQLQALLQRIEKEKSQQQLAVQTTPPTALQQAQQDAWKDWEASYLQFQQRNAFFQ